MFKKVLLSPEFRPKLSRHCPFKKMSAYSKCSGYALNFIIVEGFFFACVWVCECVCVCEGGGRGMLDNSEQGGRKPNKFLGTVQCLS